MKNNYLEDFVNPKYFVNLDFDNLISYTDIEEHSTGVPKLVVAILMFIVMIVNLVNLWWIAFAISALLFLFSFPKTSNRLQKSMGIIFPNKFFWTTAFLLMVASFSSMGFHKYIDDLKATKAEALAEQQRQEEILEKQEQERIAKEKEQQRQDSLSYHLDLAQTYLDKRMSMESVREYELALSFAESGEQSEISYKIASILFIKKQYDKALKYYNQVNRNPSLLDTLQYNKAICYVNTGDIPLAVAALRQSEWSPRVNTLFNKINPLKNRISYVDKPVQKKRIAYYTILCRDGSTSHSSSRRGTCSHHGGVADWEHPVYETYTENQRKKVVEKYREYGEW